MSLQELEIQIKELELQIKKLGADNPEIIPLQKELKELETKAYSNLSAYDRLYLARKSDRPNTREYIKEIFDDFLEFKGDRYTGDDGSIIGGIARFDGVPVTIVGNLKGRTLEENLKCNFGMSSPEGYRKALRLMKQADKFNRPIITFIDTPGAYPGLEAEERGIGEAIAQNLKEMFGLRVPIIAIVIGEGGSGGALALSIADRLIMLENAVYSVLSPEGFASILWKDQAGKRVEEAASVMKITAEDLYDLGVIDKIIQEPIGGITKDRSYVYKRLERYIRENLKVLLKQSPNSLLHQRYQKFRKMGKLNEK